MVSPSKNIPSTHLAEAPESQSSRLLEHDSTLTAGQSVSLTLGSDSLVVVGMVPLPLSFSLCLVFWMPVIDANLD